MFIQKIILVGDVKSGKSAICKNLDNQGYTDEYKRTVGTEFYSVSYQKGKQQIWDIGGDFINTKSMTPTYFRGASNIFICISAVESDKYKYIEKYYQFIQKNCDNLIKISLIVTKIDLVEDMEKLKEEFNKIAEIFVLDSYFVSAKNNSGIKAAFSNIIGSLNDESIDEVFLDIPEDNKKTKGCKEFFSKLFCCFYYNKKSEYKSVSRGEEINNLTSPLSMDKN